jgi:hypothetical protein
VTERDRHPLRVDVDAHEGREIHLFPDAQRHRISRPR